LSIENWLLVIEGAQAPAWTSSIKNNHFSILNFQYN